MERWVTQETIYKGRIVTLVNGHVELDDGHRARREVIQHPGAVGVVPFTGERVVLIRQYRIAAEKYLLEIPAGKLEPTGESPEERGRIELEEETGYRAATMIPAGMFFPSAGILTERIHLFLAFDLETAEQNLEEDERIEVVELLPDEVRRMLAAHAFEDGKTIIGLHALLAHLDLADKF